MGILSDLVGEGFRQVSGRPRKQSNGSGGMSSDKAKSAVSNAISGTFGPGGTYKTFSSSKECEAIASDVGRIIQNGRIDEVIKNEKGRKDYLRTIANKNGLQGKMADRFVEKVLGVFN